MHQPIDTEFDAPTTTAPATDPPPPTAQPEPRPLDAFDMAITELRNWVVAKEAEHAAVHQEHARLAAPVHPEPAHDVIDIPHDVPCFESF